MGAAEPPTRGHHRNRPQNLGLSETEVRACPPGRLQPCHSPPTSLQARMRAVSDIVTALVAGVRAGRDVDLNAVKREAAVKYRLGRSPKLVEIIAALPEEYRQELLPQ